MVILVKLKINCSQFISFRGSAVANVKKYSAALKSEIFMYRSDVVPILSNGQLLTFSVSNKSVKS